MPEAGKENNPESKEFQGASEAERVEAAAVELEVEPVAPGVVEGVEPVGVAVEPAAVRAPEMVAAGAVPVVVWVVRQVVVQVAAGVAAVLVVVQGEE